MLLACLVEKSLVVLEESTGRYRLLETVRQYAREKLAETREDATVARWHMAYFVPWAEEASRQMSGPEQAAWLASMETELDNLRAALDCCRVEEDGTDAGLRLSAAMHRLWFPRGYWSEAEQRLREALARGDPEQPCRDRAVALIRLANIYWPQRRLEEARGCSEQAMAICLALDEKQLEPRALETLGIIAYREGRYGEARSLYQRALGFYVASGNQSPITLANLALAVLAEGDKAQGLELFERAEAILEEQADLRGLAFALEVHGRLELAERRPAIARKLLERAV